MMKRVLLVLAGVGSPGCRHNRRWCSVDGGQHQISRHIYGHFSEHLGARIYGGFYGENNQLISNTRGIRNDVVDALKKMNIPNLREARRLLRRYLPLEGRNWSQEPASHVGEHLMGSGWKTTARYTRLLGHVRAVGNGALHLWQRERALREELPNGYSTPTSPASARCRAARHQWTRETLEREVLGCRQRGGAVGGNMTAEYHATASPVCCCLCRRNSRENKIFRIASGASSDDYHWTEVLMRDVPHEMLMALHSTIM